MHLIKKHSSFLIAVLVLAILVTFFEYGILAYTNGQLAYPLDDTFIHMAISKNLAFNHVWGINSFEFSAASSSLLYTFLLAAAFKIFGLHIAIPLIINCIAGILLLWYVHIWLQKNNYSFWQSLIILSLVIFLTPLPSLIIAGMEHVLQCLFAFLLIYRFSEWYNTDDRIKKIPLSLVVLFFLTTAIRYEGIFIAMILCLLLLYRRKISSSFILGSVALLPIVVMGFYSLNKGSFFFPNSVLIKSDSLEFSLRGIIKFVGNIFTNKYTLINTDNIPAGTARPGISLLTTQRLLIILPTVGLLILKFLKEKKTLFTITIILSAVTLLHLALAATGWFYRYEAYLILCSVVLISVTSFELLKHFSLKKNVWQTIFLLLISFFLFFPFLLRSGAALSKTKQACINIYDQQYQMGQFLKTYYPTTPIAANDIGAVSFFSNAHNLDLWGLGSIDIAKARKGNYWTPIFIDSTCHNKNISFAIIYDSWFDSSLTDKWKKVATWRIQNNVICGDDIVSFYAIDPNATVGLLQNLKSFESRLPKTVEVKYY